MARRRASERRAPWLSRVRPVYQPVVDLRGGGVVGVEALARPAPGAAAQGSGPLDLLAEAARSGTLVELDRACRESALVGAVEQGLPADRWLFLNTEPQALRPSVVPALREVQERLGSALRLVLEVTERALLADPAALLDLAAEVRGAGWLLALDDVGLHPSSLALLPLLRPDVVKLDLRLVQGRTTVHVADIVTAVNAEAERIGALVLAEGVETEEQAALAAMMGATLGQGYLFGRPGALADLALEAPAPTAGAGTARGDLPAVEEPFALVQGDPRLRVSTKPLLVAISRQLERQALAAGESAVVLATFQRRENYTATTARRYEELARSTSLVGSYAQGLGSEPPAGVRAVHVDAADPLVQEWDVVVVGPHAAGALLSRDLGDDGPDAERRFSYVVTYERDTVLAAARALLRRLAPAPGSSEPPDGTDGVATTARSTAAGADDGLLREVSPGLDASGLLATPPPVAPGPAVVGEVPGPLDAVLAAALVCSDLGMVVADARADDLPLVWVNDAFVALTGYAREEMLGRNCRYLQCEDTDPAAVAHLREQLRAGSSARTILVNRRRDGTLFWNDVALTPVHDAAGTLTHVVGQQQDVSERVRTQQRAEHLATHDPLTDLANRSRLDAHLTREVARASVSRSALALLFLDVDGFKEVNDGHGHAAGDDLLRVVARRLQGVARTSDLLARVGGDEFVLVLAGLGTDASIVALQRASELLDALTAPITLVTRSGGPFVARASIGVSVLPADARDADELLGHADQAMYVAKRAGGGRALLWVAPGPAASRRSTTLLSRPASS